MNSYALFQAVVLDDCLLILRGRDSIEAAGYESPRIHFY
jgi:hypothetical protein